MTAASWADDQADDVEALAELAELLPDRCWACAAGLPHVHGTAGEDCAHAFADGDLRTCCADHDAGRVALVALAYRLRAGAVVAPDDPAELDGPAGPESPGGQL